MDISGGSNETSGSLKTVGFWGVGLFSLLFVISILQFSRVFKAEEKWSKPIMGSKVPFHAWMSLFAFAEMPHYASLAYLSYYSVAGYSAHLAALWVEVVCFVQVINVWDRILSAKPPSFRGHPHERMPQPSPQEDGSGPYSPVHFIAPMAVNSTPLPRGPQNRQPLLAPDPSRRVRCCGGGRGSAGLGCWCWCCGHAWCGGATPRDTYSSTEVLTAIACTVYGFLTLGVACVLWADGSVDHFLNNHYSVYIMLLFLSCTMLLGFSVWLVALGLKLQLRLTTHPRWEAVEGRWQRRRAAAAIAVLLVVLAGALVLRVVWLLLLLDALLAPSYKHHWGGVPTGEWYALSAWIPALVPALILLYMMRRPGRGALPAPQGGGGAPGGRAEGGGGGGGGGGYLPPGGGPGMRAGGGIRAPHKFALHTSSSPGMGAVAASVRQPFVTRTGLYHPPVSNHESGVDTGML